MKSVKASKGIKDKRIKENNSAGQEPVCQEAGRLLLRFRQGNGPQGSAAVIGILQLIHQLLQIPLLGTVHIVGGIGNGDISIVIKLGNYNKMAILSQRTAAHQSDQDMSAAEESCGILGRAVADTFYLETKGRDAVRNQAVIGTAVAGIAVVGSGPFSHIDGSDTGGTKAVDYHCHTDRAAAISADGIQAP